MARVFVTRRSQQRFEALDPTVRARVRKALEEICAKPRVGKALTGPLTGEFSFRVGAYRIIYTCRPAEDTVLETVRHRREVYRRRKPS